jgi:diguanylate cyclase (GGDEF)-like protein
MKVGTKIILGFSVPILMFFAFGLWLNLVLKDVSGHLRHVKEESVTFALMAKDMEKDVTQVQQFLSDISATRALDGFDDGFKGAEIHSDNFNINLARFEQMLALKGDLKGIERINLIRADFNAFYANGTKMARAYIDGGTSEGNRLMPGFDRGSLTLQNSLSPLIKTQLDEMNGAVEKTRSAADQVRIAGLILGMLAIIISVLVARATILAFNLHITQRKQAEEEIKNLAFYDPLTQLPNRRLLMDRLKQALASSARSGREGALLFIDLDNFKTLNDTLGHDVGDLLLQQVAQRLESCVREGDTVARLGGDEFVVMLEDLSEHDLEAAAQAETVGEKILLTLNQPYQLATHEYRSTPSIGVTLFSDHEQNQDELLKHADIAMYQAKKAGRNSLRFFDPQMQETITVRASLESDLRHAIAEQKQFQLFYQAQVDSSGRLVGAEALLRWQHPGRGMVSPADFIPLAEESGLILPLGNWVLTTACQQLAAWAMRPETAHLTLAVNVSAKQFHLPTFAEEVLALVDYYVVSPAKLKLEISMLRAINFSMDDFGTGYSSQYSNVCRPISSNRQSFVRDIASDDNDKAIVRTIIAMAQGLNLNIIAEGVETLAQRQLLLDRGCTTYQGYLLGRPIPIEKFDALL